MNLRIKGHTFHYALESLCRVFYPDAHIHVLYAPDSAIVPRGTREIETERSEDLLLIKADFDGTAYEKEKPVPEEQDAVQFEKTCELWLSQMLYEILHAHSGYTPAWGIQTGVRPSKLLRRLDGLYGSEQEAESYFRDALLITEEKTRLTREVVRREAAIIGASQANSYSLYLSIPFCPSRCSYCSFISHSIERATALVPAYLQNLHKELAEIAAIAEEYHLKLESVYIGGGTPTALSAEQLSDLFSCIAAHFPANTMVEYTIEAGRPDTFTKERLEAIRNSAVNRITVNAQTFHDLSLEAIGRRHTAQQTEAAFQLARSYGFENINMDLIAGLPEDTLDTFQDSVERAIALGAENITVHTLAMKRSSDLVSRAGEEAKLTELTAQMLRTAQAKLTEAGYVPYYMYRQSKSLGNLENVGWCKPGYECAYNIYMMEEVHTIFGAGAGAVTRMKSPKSEYIKRIYNYKYPYEYIDLFREMQNRKGQVRAFLNEHY